MIDFEDNPDNDEQLMAIAEENLISTRLSGPQEPPTDQSTTHSLDSEFGGFDVPFMGIPRVKKATTNEKL